MTTIPTPEDLDDMPIADLFALAETVAGGTYQYTRMLETSYDPFRADLLDLIEWMREVAS